jgi:hypothetical protein
MKSMRWQRVIGWQNVVAGPSIAGDTRPPEPADLRLSIIAWRPQIPLPSADKIPTISTTA